MFVINEYTLIARDYHFTPGGDCQEQTLLKPQTAGLTLLMNMYTVPIGLCCDARLRWMRVMMNSSTRLVIDIYRVCLCACKFIHLASPPEEETPSFFPPSQQKFDNTNSGNSFD